VPVGRRAPGEIAFGELQQRHGRDRPGLELLPTQALGELQGFLRVPPAPGQVAGPTAGDREVGQQRAPLRRRLARVQVQRGVEVASRFRPFREARAGAPALAVEVDQTAAAPRLPAPRLERRDGVAEEPDALVVGPHVERALPGPRGVLDQLGGVGDGTGRAVVAGDVREAGLQGGAVQPLDGFGRP
jgi:hypothetical protein